MRIQSLLLIFFVLFSVNTFSSVPKDDKKKGENGDEQLVEPVYVEGIVYALPRTGFVVDVCVRKTTFKPGPYYQYAQKYLGIDNAMGAASVNCDIVSIELENFSEADPNAMFKALDTVASQLSLLSDGVISGINSGEFHAEDKVCGDDFIVASEKMVTDFIDLSSDDFYEILVDPETGVESMELKGLEDKAREAADYLIRLRKKRSYAILNPSDVIPEDGRGYEVFVKEAKRLDKAYSELFIGKKSTSKKHFSFIYLPEENNVKNEVLFRFSEEKGVLPKTDISGKPIFLSLTKETAAYNTAEKLKASDNPQAGESGVFYRTPVKALVSVSDGLQTLYSGRATVAQFGSIVPLPEKLLDGNYKIQFNTKTGSIKSISEIK